MDEDVGSVSTVCSDTESDFVDVALEACSFGSFALGAQDTPTRPKAKAKARAKAKKKSGAERRRRASCELLLRELLLRAAARAAAAAFPGFVTGPELG